MPVKLPSASDLMQGTPSAGNRVTSYRPSYAPETFSRSNIRAADVTIGADDLVKVGERIGKAGEELQKQKQKKDLLTIAGAKSEWLRMNLDLENSLNDGEYQTYDKRYIEGVNKNRSKIAPYLKGLDPENQQLLMLDLDDDVTRTRDRLQQKSLAKKKDHTIAFVADQGQKNLDAALTADPKTANQLLQANAAMLDGAVAQGDIEESAAVSQKRKWAETYGENWASVQPPEKLINVITKARETAAPEDIINSTIEIEGGYSASDGASKAPVIYGINRKYHEAAHDEAKKITDEQGPEAGKKYAAEFYKKEYYDQYDLGQFTPDVQQVLFDGVINHSKAFNKKLISAAVKGAKPQELIELRREEYQRLGKNANYAPSLPGWMNRLDKVQGNIGKTGTPLDFIPADKRIKLRNEIVKNTLTSAIENDPLAAMTEIQSGKFGNILLSSEKAEYEKKARSEIVSQNNQKINEPAAFAMRKGYIEPEQLAYSVPEQLSEQITNRLPVLAEMNKEYGSPIEPLTKDEAAAVSQHLSEITSTERLDYLKSLRDSSGNDEIYRTVINQIRPNSPVTAWAGSFVDLDKQMTTENWFTKDENIPAGKVAERLTRGEELINPPKGEKAKIKMPTETNLRPEFDDYAGEVYKDFPDSADEAYQAVSAYYASLSAEEGDYSGEFDGGRYQRALKEVLGNVESVNGNEILLPWGMESDQFSDAIEKGFTQTVEKHGMKNWQFDDVDFMNTGISGVYQIYNGTAPLIDKQGNPLYVDIND